MTTETQQPSAREAQLADRIDQLIGWAKVGQRPGYPAKARYYELKAENADRLRDDILKVIRELGSPTLEALRQQVQQARDTHYELACDHSEMAGHEVQEAREFGRVAAYDEVLALLAAPEGE